MDADAFKTNLKTVKELILDEHKLVTYTTLSKELCIHVNQAKSLLSQIVQDIRKADPKIDLSVCYMVSGLLNNNSGCTTVCSEKDKETIKDTLKIIFYEHVYCVGRGIKSVDNVALTAINKFEDLPLCTGLIKANSCSKRTNDELGNLKSKNHVAVIHSKPNVQPKTSKDKVKDVIRKSHEDTKKLNEIKTETNIKSEIPSPKKNVSNDNKTPSRINGNKGIAGFFSKGNGNSTKAKNGKVNMMEVKVEKDINVENVVNIKKDVKVKPTSKDSTITSKTEKSAPYKNPKDKGDNNSLTQIKKTAKVDKKRKRLLHVSDSESETEANDPFTNEMDIDHESEDEIPPTPTVNTVKITSGIVNPKKRRKVVDKLYTDEDGFILTKKEEVYESFSENDEDPKENNEQIKENVKLIKENSKELKENTKQVKGNTEAKHFKTETSPKANKNKKKLSPPQKGKQSTINSFFKKA